MRSFWIILLMLQNAASKMYGINDSGSAVDSFDFASESLHPALIRRLQDCSDELIGNGNMEGNTGVSLWGAALGGTVRIRLGGRNGSPNSLESYERTTKASGPSYELDTKCLAAGSQYIFMSHVKVLLDSDRPIIINKHAPPEDPFFLGLAARSESSNGKATSIALPNTDHSTWVKDGWNVYRAIITVNELMIASSRLFLDFAGPKAGTKIVVDDVSLQEYIVSNITCSKTLFLDTAEKGQEYNWNLIKRGSFDVVTPGAQGSEHSYRSRKRESGWDGIVREINRDCIIPGAPYEVRADMRLTTNKQRPFSCKKLLKGVGSKNSCPLMSINMRMPGGKSISQKSWNTDKLWQKWKAKEYNTFVAKFKLPEEALLANKVELGIVGMEKFAYLFVDNIRFFIGCETAFINSYAELKHTRFWASTEQSLIRLTSKSYAGKKAFMNTGRQSSSAGIGQEIDPFCLKEVRQYEFIAQVAILNRKLKHVVVDKWAKPGDNTYLILTLEVTLASGEVKTIDYPNQDRSEWVSGKYNQYRAIFQITPEFKSATKAFLYLRGPMGGYVIVLDNAFVPEFKERNCFDQLLIGDEESTHANLKGADKSVGWKISEPSFLNVIPFKGKNKYYFIHTGRIAGDPGLIHNLDPNCFFEGMSYSFRSLFKIKDGNNKDISCSKDMHILENDQACPFVGIRMQLPSGEKWMYGRVSEDWNAKKWNEISFDFTASADLGNALSVTLVITGPAPGVKIFIDGIDLVGNWPSTAPSNMPSISPTLSPTSRPSISPTNRPSFSPSLSPTGQASNQPSNAPIESPTTHPSVIPSFLPTNRPTSSPSVSPTELPTPNPTLLHSNSPSFLPTNRPTSNPSVSPTDIPTSTPTSAPSVFRSTLPSTTPTVTSQPTSRSCTPIVQNGDAENGSTIGWTTSFGGELDTTEGGAGDSLHAFNYHNRDSHTSGPEQNIPKKCIEEGMQYEFTARITLRDEDNNPFFCSKEAKWRSEYFCVVLLIKRENKSGTKFINFANEDSSYWIENEFNSFRTVFTGTFDLASLKRLSISLIGPRAGVSIVFDDLSIREYDGSGPSCNELILNGDMERGSLGWKAINGGNVEVTEKGADVDGFVLKNTQRTTSYAGISQQLNSVCIIPGKFFEFKAMMKILDGQGNPMACDKSIETMGHADKCPSVSLHVTYPTTTELIQLKNELLLEWVANDFNLYHSFFVGINLQEADKVALIISGIRPDASIILDNISFDKTVEPSERSGDGLEASSEYNFFGVLQPHHSFDGDNGNHNMSVTTQSAGNPRLTVKERATTSVCSELVENGDAESGKTTGWSASFGGHVSLNAHGANGSNKSFESYGRQFAASGPKHYLAINCLKKGDRFELTAYIKLKDKSGEPLVSNKHAVWGEESFLTASIYLIKASGDEIINLANEDPSQWMATEYNMYRSVLAVTPNFAGASEAFLYFRGPGVGVSIDFDDVSLARYTAPSHDCKELIPHVKAEIPNLRGWSVASSGEYINLGTGVDDNGDMFFENAGRTSYDSGPKYAIDTNCLMKDEYEFEAHFKLISKEGIAVTCTKDERDNISSCPLVSIEFTIGQDERVFELENMVPTQWITNDFNRFYATFKMTEELTSAESAVLYINGVAPDVSILFSEVTFKQHEAPDCRTLITNGGAEDGGIVPWNVFFSGNLNVVKGGANESAHAFIHGGRTSYTSGPKQNVDVDCFVEGTQYELKAKVKLEDENGEPFFCNKDAEWKSEFYCIILSIKISDSSGTKILNLANDNPSLWREKEFNDFHAVFTATKELLAGRDMFFLLRGPRTGVSIIFDEVSVEMSKAKGL